MEATGGIYRIQFLLTTAGRAIVVLSFYGKDVQYGYLGLKSFARIVDLRLCG